MPVQTLRRSTILVSALAVALSIGPALAQQSDIRILPITLTSPHQLVAGDPNISLFWKSVPALPVPENIYVRIFRGNKKQLIKDIPKMYLGSCVTYSTHRLHAQATGQMHMPAVDATWLSDTGTSTVTLVFEASDRAEDSTLRLERGKVEEYFNAGTEMVLQAPAGWVPVSKAPHLAAAAEPVKPAPVSYHGPVGGGEGRDDSWAGTLVGAGAPAKRRHEVVAIQPCNTVGVYTVRVDSPASLPDVNLGATPTTVAELTLRPIPCGL